MTTNPVIPGNTTDQAIETTVTPSPPITTEQAATTTETYTMEPTLSPDVTVEPLPTATENPPFPTESNAAENIPLGCD